MAVPDKVKELEATTFKLLVEEHQLSTTLPSSALTETSEIDEERRRTQVKQDMIVSFTRAKAEMISDGSKDELEPHDSAIHAAKSDSWDGITEWEELPLSLVNWVQSQRGLCIDQVPMSSIDELVTAYYLLHIEGDPIIQNPAQSSTWEVVDASIPTTTGGALSKHWKKFLDNGIDLTQYPRRCHIYWSQAYMITKRQQLEEEKAKVEKAAT
ncbi:hypothetical protein PHISP_04473 [Aspergillus sp. HF37]|nr:hypothetical protein PHISP_04473 [Aspergillus sp. HF37]